MKRALASTLLLAIFISLVTGMQFVNVTEANPYPREYVSPDAYTKPPRISIFTPENNTAYRNTTIQLSINVSLPESTTAYETYVLKVYYEADWLENGIYLYESKGLADEIASFQLNPQLHYFDYSGDISVPRGNHNLVVYAEGGGAYPPQGGTLPVFSIVGSSSVFFVAGDQSPPKVMLLSIENKIYGESNIPLNFTVNESCSHFSYVLDNQIDVAINGNTTLSDLPVGNHNLTVYAWDNAGNLGTSETIYFTVEEPFPSSLVFTVSVGTALVAIGLFAYFKKRKRRR